MIMRPQFVVTVLAAVASFATVLTLGWPLLARDRTQQRMRVMATERDKMRAARMADFAKEGTSRLRHTNKGFMQQIVDRLNLRKAFESDEIKNKLKMAGMRGQAPLVAYMFFRLVMPIIVVIVAFFYVFWIAKLAYPPLVKAGMAIGAGYLGFYLP